MNTFTKTSILPALATTLLIGFGSAQSQRPDIVGIATKAGQFKTLTAALTAAGLVEALQGEGPLTVFAPTDAAFARLPKGTVENLLEPENRDQLSRILQFHVVSGNVDAATALRAGTAETLMGESVQIKLEKGALTVNGARVLDNDIAASNGVIHVIDSVLLPTPLAAKSPNQRAMDLITLAVERGVPLFNDGNIEACADIYELASRSLVALGAGQLSPGAIAALSEALTRSDDIEDPRQKAWALRGGLNRAYTRLEQDAPKDAASPTAQRQGKTVFGFDDASGPRWFTLNDDVMGGVSSSAVRLTEDGTAVFEGALSLDNNGGFATIRSANSDLELDGYDTLLVRIKGDGRTYGLHALPSSNRGGASYWAAQLDTVDGEWTEISIPIASMKRTIMGQRVPFAGPIDPAKIRSLSFMIADKNESPFRLEIDWIKAARADGNLTARL